MTPLLELKDIRRSYPAGDEQVEVLKGITLDIYAGEMVAIVGASGSGKSTLMNILGCLDKATSAKLGTHILKCIFTFDILSDCNTIVSDKWCTI